MGQLHIRKMSGASAFKLCLSRGGQGDLSSQLFGSSKTRGGGLGGHRSDEDPIGVSTIFVQYKYLIKLMILVSSYIFSFPLINTVLYFWVNDTNII